MADLLIKDTTLTNIANAIREKFGSGLRYTPVEMISAIRGLTNATTFKRIVGRNGTTIDDTIGEVESLRSYALAGYESLTTVNFPQLRTMGDYALFDCPQLCNVNLPSLETIGNCCFQECIRLANLYLPVTTAIQDRAFCGCRTLERVVLGASTVCELGEDAFEDTPIADGVGYIYVPDALVQSYKNSAQWSGIQNQIRPLSELE